MKSLYPISFFIIFFLQIHSITFSQRQMELLDRGIIAVRYNPDSAFISWRILASDPEQTSFNLYRKTGNNQTVKLNENPIADVSWFIDSKADFNQPNYYFVKTLSNGKESSGSKMYMLPAKQKPGQYLSIPLQIPADGDVLGQKYTYSANDASVADLDGDGEYEVILKWDPSLTRNPPQTGLTGEQIIDAYKLNGRLLWRINLGKNVRAGAAYTQFLVYDFDGDGKAEMICKTADGSRDGLGNYIGDKDRDWRTLDPKDNTYGKIVNGPEYLTVFDGLTGKALTSQEYIPTRYPLDGWGGVGGNGGNDNTGGRSDRFSAGVAYLDGVRPSAVFVRGWYGRTVVAAWDYRNGKLTSRWIFDSKDANNPYSGQGNHSVSVADMDNDGKDEFCVGSMTVDDNGQGLYSTGLRHGDALHITDMDPDRPGLEVFGVHENEESTIKYQTPGAALFDARTGEIIFSKGPGVDVGRGVAADIDPTHRGLENWGGPGGLRDVKGNTISEKVPSSVNFVIWWDGDLTRELLDKNRIDKWDWVKDTTMNLFTAKGCVSNNGTKSTPCLTADIFGDWREEVIWRTDDNKELRIYTTVIPTPYKFYTLMHDPEYRLSIAWQNVAYNQPPHPGFYFGDGMKNPPKPNIYFQPVALPDTNFKSHKPLISDNFKSLSTKKWTIETSQTPNNKVYVKSNKLIIDTKDGVTVWFNQKLEGNFSIEFNRTVIADTGKNDRLSDMNVFWMASDPLNTNLFKRDGVLEKYDSLQLYYVGMGGNTNKTTRFRKYDGNGNRVLLHEYTDEDHLLLANHTYHIKIVVKDGITSYWTDGQCYFSYPDPKPLKNGYFGFRSTWSHQEITDFKITKD